jgi:hypothetical protein
MAGKSPYATKLKKSTDVIANVTSVRLSGYKRESLDMTDLNSTDDFMEYEGGFCDGGELAVELNWNPLDASHKTKVLADCESGATVTYTIEWGRTGVSVAITGHWTGFDPSAQKGNPMTLSGSFKISGKPVWTYPV